MRPGSGHQSAADVVTYDLVRDRVKPQSRLVLGKLTDVIGA